MKVLVTGHNGFIGSVLVPMVQKAGHQVVGLDSFYYSDCIFGEPPSECEALRTDVRDVQLSDLRGFDAIMHLAALSNDPLGNLNPNLTHDINQHASIRLARLAKQAGVSRFLFSSSCSLYGAGGDALRTEESDFNPITPYAQSKVEVEKRLSEMADDNFTPTYLRNATAYGMSARLRMDVVVNNLVGSAVTTGQIINKSDGTPWRPLVHIEDISQAFIRALEAPRNLVHNEAFNVGSTTENYQVRELSEMVRETVPGSKISYADGAGPDPRCYRVDCGKIASVLNFKSKWTLFEGVKQAYETYIRHGLTTADFEGPKYQRIRTIQKHLNEGRLDIDLRWVETAVRA